MAIQAPRINIRKKYESLRDIVLNIDPEIHKADEGNKAASKRARKGLQEAKKLCMEIRKLCLQITKD